MSSRIVLLLLLQTGAIPAIFAQYNHDYQHSRNMDYSDSDYSNEAEQRDSSVGLQQASFFDGSREVQLLGDVKNYGGLTPPPLTISVRVPGSGKKSYYSSDRHHVIVPSSLRELEESYIRSLSAPRKQQQRLDPFGENPSSTSTPQKQKNAQGVEQYSGFIMTGNRRLIDKNELRAQMRENQIQSAPITYGIPLLGQHVSAASNSIDAQQYEARRQNEKQRGKVYDYTEKNNIQIFPNFVDRPPIPQEPDIPSEEEQDTLEEATRKPPLKILPTPANIQNFYAKPSPPQLATPPTIFDPSFPEPVLQRGFIPSFGPPTKEPFIMHHHHPPPDKSFQNLLNEIEFNHLHTSHPPPQAEITTTSPVPVLRPEYPIKDKDELDILPTGLSSVAPEYEIIPKERTIYKHLSVHVPTEELEEEVSSAKVVKVEKKPEKHVKYIFIKPSETPTPQTEVEIPTTPQQKTLVYVLSESGGVRTPIKLVTPNPLKPAPPQVYFLRYNDDPNIEASEPPPSTEATTIRTTTTIRTRPPIKLLVSPQGPKEVEMMKSVPAPVIPTYGSFGKPSSAPRSRLSLQTLNNPTGNSQDNSNDYANNNLGDPTNSRYLGAAETSNSAPLQVSNNNLNQNNRMIHGQYNSNQNIQNNRLHQNNYNSNQNKQFAPPKYEIKPNNNLTPPNYDSKPNSNLTPPKYDPAINNQVILPKFNPNQNNFIQAKFESNINSNLVPPKYDPNHNSFMQALRIPEPTSSITSTSQPLNNNNNNLNNGINLNNHYNALYHLYPPPLNTPNLLPVYYNQINHPLRHPQYYSYLRDQLNSASSSSSSTPSSIQGLYTVAPYLKDLPGSVNFNSLVQQQDGKNLHRNARNYIMMNYAPTYMPSASEHVPVFTSPADFLKSLLGDSYMYYNNFGNNSIYSYNGNYQFGNISQPPYTTTTTTTTTSTTTTPPPPVIKSPPIPSQNYSRHHTIPLILNWASLQNISGSDSNQQPFTIVIGNPFGLSSPGSNANIQIRNPNIQQQAAAVPTQTQTQTPTPTAAPVNNYNSFSQLVPPYILTPSRTTTKSTTPQPRISWSTPPPPPPPSTTSSPSSTPLPGVFDISRKEIIQLPVIIYDSKSNPITSTPSPGVGVTTGESVASHFNNLFKNFHQNPAQLPRTNQPASHETSETSSSVESSSHSESDESGEVEQDNDNDGTDGSNEESDSSGSGEEVVPIYFEPTKSNSSSIIYVKNNHNINSKTNSSASSSSPSSLPKSRSSRKRVNPAHVKPGRRLRKVKKPPRSNRAKSSRSNKKETKTQTHAQNR